MRNIDSTENNFPRDTKRRIWEITINNGWNTYIVKILCETRDVIFIFKEKNLSRLPKPVNLSQE